MSELGVKCKTRTPNYNGLPTDRPKTSPAAISNDTRRNVPGSEFVCCSVSNLANELQKYDYKSFTDADLKRRIFKLTKLGYQALSEDKLKQLIDVITRMNKNFDNVNVCQYRNETNCNIKVVVTLNSEWKMMAKSRDPEELKHYWVQWHDAAGKPVRKDFEKYVTLRQEAAQLNNITYSADYWLRKYDDSSFEAQIDAAIKQIRPLYEQLHAYVRYKLRKVYGSDIVSEKGPIPIHLLGNLWGRKWDNIVDITVPYPSTPLIDITEELVGQGYTAVKMFEIADEFVQSLNMSKLPPTFWEKSILEDRKDGRDRACHPAIWDFYRKDDIRIKRCTHVTMKDFLRLQHELGYTQYYQQYQNQPSVYRDEAMPGFYEAIGHVFSLSVSTPKHLQKIGLLKEYVSNEESKINQLFHSALRKVVYLPNVYTLAKYYLEIYRGHIKPKNYNCKFWEMSSKHAGVEPPVMRSKNDFDGVIRYALFADLHRLKFLLSYILQFQLYKAACEKAGEYVKGDPTKPLNNCDIYQSPAAGNALKKVMALGSSKPWPEIMQTLTGQRKLVPMLC
ncbi:hypothetical protein ZHAS_00022060 [Anopheles sinensis]|uniref:Angiotensin-converting enzyme n=1 Tax=Anopheles sinensis TaxID=74873 RepID=A0A084WUC5_ANOSI|nr:hypothetical protein ZHAS_00022060 [Anopheles sinensis]